MVLLMRDFWRRLMFPAMGSPLRWLKLPSPILAVDTLLTLEALDARADEMLFGLPRFVLWLLRRLESLTTLRSNWSNLSYPSKCESPCEVSCPGLLFRGWKV